MKKRRWIAVFLCLVIAITQLYIPSETAQAETSYDEATVLDEMASSWLKTCEKNVAYCVIGLGKFELGALTKDTQDAIKKQLLGDILTGHQGTTNITCEVSVENLCNALGSDALKSDIGIYEKPFDPDDLDSRLAHATAENSIKNTVKNGEVADGISVVDVIKENYSLIIGLVECNEAIGYFNNALNTSDIDVKRQNMLRGALLGTIGCQMSISDTDALLKNEDDSVEELLVKVAEAGVDLVGEIVPEIGIAKDVLTITADVGIKVLSMADKVDALIGFINSPVIAEEDMSAYFDALSNQYGLYTFEISDLEVIMNEYTGYLATNDEYKIVKVPENIYGFPVTGFSGCFAEELDITEISIPSGVNDRALTHVINNCDSLEKVYYNAIACEGWYLGSFFYGCDSNFEVIFGENVTVIPERFILSCGISSIVFPEGITTMHAASLMDCANLESVTIPSTVTLFDISYGDPGVISNCESLETVYYNAIDVDENYYNGVFTHCGNDAEEMSIVFGEKINSTPYIFLYDCGVKSVVFPEGMTKIRDYAISKCQRLESITIPSTITMLGDDFLGNEVFSECNNLKTVNYNAKNAIGYEVFYNIQSDFEINFGEGITEIPEDFISNCGITSITFPEGVVTINANCLVNCDSLEYVTVPTTVTTIGYNFVSDCENIDTIYYNATCIESPSSTIISNCGNVENPHMKVILGDNVTTVPEYFIENCGITNFSYPEGVTTINADSLVECSALKTVVIPSTVKAIDNDVVSGCENLSDIYYGAIDAQRIGSYGYVFDNCGNICGLEIHFIGNIETIPSKFMRNCGVSSVTFPEGITTMGSYILVGCEKLETVTVPSSLSENSGSLISSCDNLKILNYHTSNINNGDSVYDKSIVYDCETDFVVNFGTSVNGLPSHFVTHSGITSIDLPASVTYVGSQAFYGCKSLEYIRFENPACVIYDSSYTLPVDTTIYGYFESTAYAYAVKYDRDFELIKEEHTGTLGVNDNFYYKYDEATQALTIIGADEFELYTDADGSEYVDMPDYTVKEVLFKGCTFSGSLYGLLGKYKSSVEKVVFQDCDTENVTNMSKMFSGCCNLTTVDLNSFRLYSGCNTNSMFSDSMCIETIHTPYYMDEDIEIELPYDFIDESGNILTSITSEYRNQLINIYKVETNVVGDVNNDGELNNLDRQILTRYLANWDGYNEDMLNLEMADVNEDGEVNNLDRQILTRHLANWEGYEELPYLDN